MARLVRHGVQPSEYRRLSRTEFSQLLQRLDKGEAERVTAMYEFTSRLAMIMLKGITQNANGNTRALMQGLNNLARAL